MKITKQYKNFQQYKNNSKNIRIFVIILYIHNIFIIFDKQMKQISILLPFFFSYIHKNKKMYENP